MTTISELTATTLSGDPVSLAQYAGKVLLVVNTASKCGFTPQYAGLQRLHQQYHDKGLVVMGFPSNEFGQQEPGDAAEIAQFCDAHYGVTFPMFAKVKVNGADAHPLFRFLKGEAPGLLGSESIKWNFTKFLIGRDGTVHKRYAPQTSPDELRSDIEALLAA